MSATHQAAPAGVARGDAIALADRWLTRGLEWLCALLVVAEIVILFVGIVARYVFHHPLIWSDELASLLFLWLAMLGAVLALRGNAHMRMTALVNRGIADGEENPLTLIKAAKFYEVQKYCPLTNHVWDGHWFCANAAAWKELPDDLKKIVADNLNAAALPEREDIANGDKAMQAELETKGLETKGLVFNAVDTQSFRDGLKNGGFYKSWRAKLGDEPWDLLEKYAGKLG